MRVPRRPRDARGVTLVELLVGVLLTGIVSAAVYGLFFSSAEAARGHEQQARVQSEARLALGYLARDVRQAVAPEGPALGRPVAAIGPAELVIHVDARRSADPALAPVPERVRYAVEAGALVREVAAPVLDPGTGQITGYGAYAGREVIATAIQNTGAQPAFSGLAPDGAPAATPAQVAAVDVRLVVGHTLNQAAVASEARLRVTLRNG